MNHLLARCGATILASLAAVTAGAPSVRVERQLELKGKLAHSDQLSGVTLWRGFMVACPDEGAELNVLDAATGRLVSRISLLDDEDDEIDMEGAASDSQYIYVVGSHSLRRKEADDDGRKRRTQVKPHAASYSLFRISLDGDGELETSERISLHDILEGNDVLRPFTNIPGKENGIDVEGLAVRDGALFVGFRGPVLSDNLVPVMTFPFDRPDDYELLYVQLDGRGIRDIVAVDDGFLILAGAVGDGDSPYTLYHWNGKDCAPATAARAGRVTALGDVPAEPKTKPEAIAAMADDPDHWQVLLLVDGDDHAQHLIVGKP